MIKPNQITMDNVILTVIGYLNDFNKLNLIKTCKEFYQLREKIQYTDMYRYWRIKHLPFIKNITKIEYMIGVDEPLVDSVPNYVTHIKTYIYDKKLKHPIANCNNVQAVAFGCYFNMSVELPKNITSLSFGSEFNKPITIPDKVIYLSFGSTFNQPLILPKSVKHLTLGLYFNQPLVLHEGIETVMFGIFFNQPIRGLLPKTVKRAIFGHYFDHDIKGHIPDSLEYLFYLGKKYRGKEIDIFRQKDTY